MVDWKEYDANITEETIKSIESFENGKSQDFVKVPLGKYTVMPTQIMLRLSNSGKPMTSAWLKIIEGDYEGQLIFNNLVMNSPFGIHNAKEFVKSLHPTEPVTFLNFSQWEELLIKVSHEFCDKACFVVNYTETTPKNGMTFSVVTVEDGAFELPPKYRTENAQ